MKKILLMIVGVLCVFSTFSQSAKVIFKPHPTFERYPVELVKETKYNMIEKVRFTPDEKLTFTLEVSDPEGEYYQLYDWCALKIFVKPGSVITVDYNNRDRTKSSFEGDLVAENTWLNQSWFLSYQRLYPGNISAKTSYREYKRRVHANADSLKRVVKDVSASGKFVKDCQIRIDFLVIGTLQNYYPGIVREKQRELSPACFEKWNNDFKPRFTVELLKDARKTCMRYKQEKVLQYRETCQVLQGIVHEIEPDFAGAAGYSLFVEEYALMQVMRDPTRLYSLELLELREKVTDPVAVQVLNTLIEEKKNLLTGVEAMDFEFQDVEGNLHKLSDYKGKPIYIDIWATWCNPCKALAPAFHALAGEYGGENIQFIAVSIDKKKGTWVNYLKEHPNVPNVLEWHSGNKKFQEYYKISGIPRFILIDKDFKIRMAFAYKPEMNELKPLLDRLLKE